MTDKLRKNRKINRIELNRCTLLIPKLGNNAVTALKKKKKIYYTVITVITRNNKVKYKQEMKEKKEGKQKKTETN